MRRVLAAAASVAVVLGALFLSSLGVARSTADDAGFNARAGNVICAAPDLAAAASDFDGGY